MKALFPLGQTVATPGALELMANGGLNPSDLLRRHQSGDAGHMSQDDQSANDRAVADGERIFSAYGEGEDRVWVITEWDRSVTTILLPEEY